MPAILEADKFEGSLGVLSLNEKKKSEEKKMNSQGLSMQLSRGHTSLSCVELLGMCGAQRLKQLQMRNFKLGVSYVLKSVTVTSCGVLCLSSK